jgi:hypothetical protein
LRGNEPSCAAFVGTTEEVVACCIRPEVHAPCQLGCCCCCSFACLSRCLQALGLLCRTLLPRVPCCKRPQGCESRPRPVAQSLGNTQRHTTANVCIHTDSPSPAWPRRLLSAGLVKDTDSVSLATLNHLTPHRDVTPQSHVCVNTNTPLPPTLAQR